MPITNADLILGLILFSGGAPRRILPFVSSPDAVRGYPKTDSLCESQSRWGFRAVQRMCQRGREVHIRAALVRCGRVGEWSEAHSAGHKWELLALACSGEMGEAFSRIAVALSG